MSLVGQLFDRVDTALILPVTPARQPFGEYVASQCVQHQLSLGFYCVMVPSQAYAFFAVGHKAALPWQIHGYVLHLVWWWSLLLLQLSGLPTHDIHLIARVQDPVVLS